MNSMSLAYQKGDLITIKQSSMVCMVSGDNKQFTTTRKPINGIFLSYTSPTDDSVMYEYFKGSTSILRACKIAIGNDIYFVDAKNFFFHIQRQEVR
jgi:hypothetical protein